MTLVVNQLSKKHPFRQWVTWQIPHTNLTLTGYSRANDKTFYHIPELSVAIDAALCEGRQVDNLFITHGHDDHIADLAYMASREGVQIYIHDLLKPYAQKYIEARKGLNFCEPFDSSLGANYTIHGVNDKSSITFGKQNQYSVDVIHCVHKVPCLGYCFSERKKVLIDELMALKSEMIALGKGRDFGRLIAEKRKNGEVIEKEITKPLFVILGDTHPKVFENYPQLLNFPVVITECTFLYDSEYDRAQRDGHTVWSDLQSIIENNPDTHFLLTHFSLRYSDKEIINFFTCLQSENSGKYRNITLWLSEDSFLQQQHQQSK